MITQKQYAVIGEALVKELDECGLERRWCESKFRYFRKILPGYYISDEDAQSRYNRGEFELGLVPGQPEGDYTALVARVRRRMLHFVREGTVTLDRVNAAFTAAGLEPYQAPVVKEAYLEMAVQFAMPEGAGSRLPESWDSQNLAGWVTAALKAYVPPPDAEFRPQVSSVGSSYTYFTSEDPEELIPEEDVEEVSPYTG